MLILDLNIERTELLWLLLTYVWLETWSNDCCEYQTSCATDKRDLITINWYKIEQHIVQMATTIDN